MVYYLSIEYLLGRSLQNAINNIELENNYTAALKDVRKLTEIKDTRFITLIDRVSTRKPL